MSDRALLWLAFSAAFAVALGLDLALGERQHDPSWRRSLRRCGAWLALALSFGALVWRLLGRDASLRFLTGYWIELSLSADNVLVFALIFEHFAIPKAAQPRLLRWGVLGAVVLRLAFVWAGVGLFHSFPAARYFFAAVLLYGAATMALRREAANAEENAFVRRLTRWKVSPALVALAAIELSDVVFAADSIPAVIAITSDPLLVFSSNVFAIMGLRSLYYLVAGLSEWFAGLRYGVAAVLAFVAAQMLAGESRALPPWAQLAIVLAILAASAGLGRRR